MAESKGLTPNSAEERQAVLTVQSARDVFGEIEKLSEILKDTAQPAATRQRAKQALGQASERLCNLMALALYQLSNNVKGPLQTQLSAAVEGIRGRLLSMGSRLMVEKLRKIDERAAAVLQAEDYPVGLSGKLDLAFANLVENLGVLGGAERLGEDVGQLVQKTEADLRSLEQVERRLGVLIDVAEPKARRPKAGRSP